MTASTTPCCASRPDRLRGRLRAALAALLLVVLALVSPLAAADDAMISGAEIVADDGSYVLNADIDFELNPRLADAVTRGVSLYFVAEVLIERPRWYWFNATVVDRELNYRLYYHAITRSYRLSIGRFHQNFDSLEAAVRTMQRIRNWQVAGGDELQAGVSHQVSLRFRLDTSQLPKPFQVTALGSRDWTLGSDWVRWTFLPGIPAFR
jgi:hypothetical protein